MKRYINNFMGLFTINKKHKRVMIQCKTAVEKSAVRRESIDGIEHIIISSATLPDDIVMNGCLYPANEIEAGFGSLEGTLAPVEHPFDANGDYISANDAHAIHNFHAGAFNKNVRREDGRVYVDKYINVNEALKSERGKRLLDRIKEIETNDQARPIHTSVGVFVNVEEISEIKTNSAGQEYQLIARNMAFDHDAILLDSVGAAQPHQGVGMAVNSDGKSIKVMRVSVDEVQGESATKLDRLAVFSETGASFDMVRKSVQEGLDRSAIDSDWIEELYQDRVIFWSKDQLFEVPFVIDESGFTTIVGIPLPVERDVTYSPKTNSEGNAMKEMILNALAAANVDAEGMDDKALLKAYNELKTSGDALAAPVADDNSGLAAIVANAVKPLADKIGGLEAQLNSANDAELTRLAELVGNSDKFQGLDVENAKKLSLDTLKGMAASCGAAYGVSPIVNMGKVGDDHAAPSEMPA